MKLRIKLLIFSLGLVIVSAGSFFVGAYYLLRRDLINEIGSRLQAIATTTALEIDGDLHDQITLETGADSEAFQSIRRHLIDVKAANGLEEHMYTFRPRGDVMEFVAMSHETPFIGDEYAYMDFDIVDEVNAVLRNGAPQRTGLFRSTNEDYISGYAPIKNSAGQVVGILSVDYTSASFNSILITKLRFLFYISLGVLVIAAIISSVAVRLITRPIQTTVDHIRQSIQDKDLNSRLPILTQDEIGDLAGWFNRFTDEIHDLMVMVQNNVGVLSDTTDEMTRRTDRLKASAADMEHKSGQVTDITQTSDEQIRNIAAEATQTASGAAEVVETNTQIGSNLKDLDEASRRMDTEVGALLEAIENLSSTIREISGNVDEASKITSQANTSAERTNITVHGLEASVNTIGEVVAVITGIAAKTNLLALNASIEAARAGEAGRGFGVVATEVKELAAQTAEATAQIEERIESIQKETGVAIEAIRDITEVIANIDQRTTSIASAVEEQTTTVTRIEDAVAMAAGQAEQVSKRAEQAATFSETVTEHARQGHASSQRIADKSGDLAEASKAVRDHVGEVDDRAKGTAEGAENLHRDVENLAQIARDLQQELTQYKL